MRRTSSCAILAGLLAVTEMNHASLPLGIPAIQSGPNSL
jgi:hypothetical protein